MIFKTETIINFPDDIKIKYIEKFINTKNWFISFKLVLSFKNDSIKMKYLNSFDLYSKIQILKSLDNSDIKKEYIKIYNIGKGEIIRSLDSDEDKIMYLKKYKRKLM